MKEDCKNNVIKNLLSNQKGMALLTTLIFVFILVTFGVSLLIMTSNDTKLSALQRDSTKAFYIAEAGVERTLYNLKKDFESSEDWNDDNLINTYILSTADTDGFRKIEYDGDGDYDVTFGSGTYTVALKINSSNYVTIKSKGKYDNSIRYVQVDAKIENVSVWNNAICGRSGMTEATISGNVEFRGSLHLLGKGLSSTDIAIDLDGTAGVGNNYKDMDPDLLSKVPPLPQTFFNEEWVDFLNAKLRVKHGQVKLSGNAYIGEKDDSGDPYIKETLQGVYVTDGFIGGDDEDPGQNVFSDNGMLNEYDLEGANIEFPSILIGSYTDPETGPYDNYLEYLKYKGLEITENEISADTLYFEHGVVGGNYIEWVAGTGQDPGILTIEGIVWVDNADGLVIGKSKGTIIFDGKGTLVSAYPEADIYIHDHLLANVTFPTADSLGLISAGDINIATDEGDAHLNIMGAFYAENTITMAYQTDLVGTFVSDYIDLGTEVPKIYQVPELINNMPPGMPGAVITYYIYTNNWHEVHG